MAIAKNENPSKTDSSKSSAIKDKGIKISSFPISFYNFSYAIINNYFLVKQANEGIPSAQLELGLRYLQGKGFPKDSLVAAYWIAKSAESGFPYGKYNLAILQYYGIANLWDPFEAYKNFLYAARRDLPEACYALGTIFLEGLLFEQNLELAFYWLNKSANLKFELAAELINKLKKNGIKFPQLDKNKNYESLSSLEIIIKSDRKDTNEYAPIIIDFENIDKNFERRNHEFLIKEAALTLRVVENIEELEKSYDEQDIFKDYTLLEKIFIASKLKSEYYVAEAFISLGLFYEKGIFVRKDLSRAFYYYTLAYRCGYNRAMIAISNLISTEEFKVYFDSELKKQTVNSKFIFAVLLNLNLINSSYLNLDSKSLLLSVIKEYDDIAALELGIYLLNSNQEESEKFLRYSAGKGNQEAALKLFLIDLLNGRIPTNFLAIEKIIEFYEKGNITAGLILAYSYDNGLFSQKNVGESIKIYRSLASRGVVAAISVLRRSYSQEKQKYLNSK